MKRMALLKMILAAFALSPLVTVIGCRWGGDDHHDDAVHRDDVDHHDDHRDDHPDNHDDHQDDHHDDQH
jgi:hypothetical protein